jgi:hypothetical protein
VTAAEDRPAGGAAPLFSVLIPSRNRAALFETAARSVLAQDETDFEIIVSDNCSDDDYGAVLRRLSDRRIRCLRTPRPVHVAENWRIALGAARGRYVIMLGDDDALLAGALAEARLLVETFDAPDMLYAMACHYAYPGALPGQPRGFFLEVRNSPLFADRRGPYALDPARARWLARRAFLFRHHISFNAQHFVWKRSLLTRLSRESGVFLEPYPDYHTAVLSFLEAERIVVAPYPLALIGISKQSFGFFLNAGREAAGLDFLTGEGGGEGRDGAEGVADPALRAALAMPGSAHYRNWLISMARLRLGHRPSADAPLGLRTFRRIQLAHCAAEAVGDAARRGALRRALGALDPAETRFHARMRRHFEWEKLTGAFNAASTARIVNAMGVYWPARTTQALAPPPAALPGVLEACIAARVRRPG